MNSKSFQKLISGMCAVTDYVEIECLDNEVVFNYRVAGLDNKTTLSEEIDQEFSYKNNNNKYVYGVFELRSLMLLSKLTPLCTTVGIYIKNDFPITLKYEVGTLGTAFFFVTPVKLGSNKIKKDVGNNIKKCTGETNKTNNVICNDVDIDYSFEICI